MVRSRRRLRSRGSRGLAAAAALGLAAACVSGSARRAEREGRNEAARADTARGAPPRNAAARTDPARIEAARRGGVRVALAVAAPSGKVGGTGGWRLFDGGQHLLVRGAAGEPWTIERSGRQLRAVRPDGLTTPFRDGPLVLRPSDPGGLVTWNGRRYRGELSIAARDSGLLVVNRLPLEDYLRGVVPLEIGATRTPDERAAVEAQAVAARSYTFVRLANAWRSYDVVATVADQVYGGAEAERPVADAAVAATRGLVLLYGGRIVSAPYHSTCGGSTAEVDEVWWREPPQPYLRRVSDRIPGTSHYYCERSPNFTWTRSYDALSLSSTLDRYLRRYAAAPSGAVGAARLVSTRGTTPSGRAAALRITTDRGSFDVRGDDMRFVLRSRGGEILNSTYFTVEPVVGPDGHLRQLTVRGGGNGHGIGMCQWGAIGRARAGQDFRTILRAYYPGTDVGPAG
jgi:stage II sporulation protein D